jgi:predicted metal-binding protein
MTPPSRSCVTAFICVTCRAGDTGEERPGRLLFNAVTSKIGSRPDCDVQVTPVECLSVCKRPCTIALMASGKWTYVVGDLDPEANVDDIISMAVSYRLSDNGIVPWRERPQSFRRGVISRVPPLGFSDQSS